MPPKKKALKEKPLDQYDLERFNFTVTKIARDTQNKCINKDQVLNVTSQNEGKYIFFL